MHEKTFEGFNGQLNINPIGITICIGLSYPKSVILTKTKELSLSPNSFNFNSRDDRI